MCLLLRPHHADAYGKTQVSRRQKKKWICDNLIQVRLQGGGKNESVFGDQDRRERGCGQPGKKENQPRAKRSHKSFSSQLISAQGVTTQGILSAIHANPNAFTSICKLYADGVGISKNRKR